MLYFKRADDPLPKRALSFPMKSGYRQINVIFALIALIFVCLKPAAPSKFCSAPVPTTYLCFSNLIGYVKQ